MLKKKDQKASTCSAFKILKRDNCLIVSLILTCCCFVAEYLVHKIHYMKKIFLKHNLESIWLINVSIFRPCPCVDWTIQKFFFLSKCKYYIHLLFTEITCTRMSLRLTEDIIVMKNTNSYNYREMVTIPCKSGLTGTTVTSQCIDVNKWSQKPPICASKIVLSAISKHAPLN